MNIKEIANLAGVSASTVSKIINQKDSSISQETRERILKIVKEYNYTPYSSISSTKKTYTIGVLISSSNYLDKVIDGIIKTAQEKGYTPLICNSNNNLDQELKNISALSKNNVDGIIWEPVSEKSLEFSKHIDKKEIPYITINCNFIENSIKIPYEDYAYNLTKELINKNHKKIACIIDKGRRKEPFFNGYKKCLFDNYLTFNQELIFSDFSDNLLYNINNRNITGIICSHYKKSLQFYNFMNLLHYKIPEDLSILSLKTDIMSDFMFPQISTFDISTLDFGKHICSKIISKIEKIEDKKNYFIPNFTLQNHSTINTHFSINSKKILVIGSINIDTYLNVSAFPHTGKTVTSSTSSVYPGGKGINQAIGVSRLGHRVSLIGNVGYDLASNTIYQALNENNVETLGVRRCKNANTGQGYIFVDYKGDSMISILNGANDMLSPNDIKEQEYLFENIKYLLIQSEIPVETIEIACEIAHKYGAKTIFKPSACASLTYELLSKIDIIIPNEDELFELCSKFYPSMEAQAASMLECGIETVIVTLKEKGCYVKTKTFDKYFNAINVLAVDKTGASDAFISALASYLLYGYELEKAIRIATYAASFCITRKGVVPALIDKNSLETYIYQQEPELLNK